MGNFGIHFHVHLYLLHLQPLTLCPNLHHQILVFHFKHPRPHPRSRFRRLLLNKKARFLRGEHDQDTINATSSQNNLVVSTYGEHVIKNTPATSAESNAVFSIYEEHVIKDTIATSSKNNIDVSTHEEHLIEDIDATSSEGDDVVSNEIMTWHDTREEEQKSPRDCIANAVEGNHEKNKKRRNKRAKCVRSNSETSAAVVAAAEEERAVVLRRTSSERHDRCGKQRMEDEKNDEFSRMSNEELNTRIEEFIRRFNRQIRLQAVRNRQNFEKN